MWASGDVQAHVELIRHWRGGTLVMSTEYDDITHMSPVNVVEEASCVEEAMRISIT